MGKQVEANLKYTKSHEWVDFGSNGRIRMGITDHAQDSLGDVTYFELPEVGKSFEAGEVLGFVESVKAVSDIYAPVDLEVTEVNERLNESPELSNHEPYGDGWYIKAKVKNPDQVNELLDSQAYQSYIESEQ